jgi:hypothetical protein
VAELAGTLLEEMQPQMVKTVDPVAVDKHTQATTLLEQVLLVKETMAELQMLAVEVEAEELALLAVAAMVEQDYLTL